MNTTYQPSIRLKIIVALFALLPFTIAAQQNVIIDLSELNGVSITPDNILNYSFQSGTNTVGKVKGMIRYRNSSMYLSYTYSYQFHSGVNSIGAGNVTPHWEFSSPSLRTLFMDNKTLPEGTWEYCVTVSFDPTFVESMNGPIEECIFHRQDGIFLINLVDPENEAKIKEYNPMLSWFANYTMGNELQYRLRMAEMKKGQNPVNAIMRNQPMFDEKNLMQSSIMYPIYAKPLEKNKWYAWTVDAYYREILLGGAETWKFMIVDDSSIVTVPATRSYVDIRRENGKTQLVFVGGMKLKYVLDRANADVLSLQLLNDRKEPEPMRPKELKASYGDNRYMLNLKDSCDLKHNKEYLLKIGTSTGETFSLPFRYLNPDLTN